MVDNVERDIKAVFVPCDVSQPIQTITIHQPQNKALQCFINHCKLHFAQNSLTPDQLRSLAADVENRSKTKDNKKTSAVADKGLIERIASMTACDMVVLQPNQPETDYISINLYVDDKGVAKQLRKKHSAQ